MCVDVSQDRRVSGCVTGHVSRKCRVSRQVSRGVSRCVTSQDHSCFSPDTTRAGALPSAPATLVFPITAGLDLLFAVCSTTRVVCAVVGEWDASTHCMPRHIVMLDTLHANWPLAYAPVCAYGQTHTQEKTVSKRKRQRGNDCVVACGET